MRCVLSLLLAALPLVAAAKDIDGLRDQHGHAFSLASWGEDRLVVVAFLGTECPLAKFCLNRLIELHAEYGPRGVGFVVVNSNPQDSYQEMATLAADLPFPVVKDVRAAVAIEFGATRSPEVFLLDAGRDVIYQGRIDDQYAPGVHAREKPRRAHLEEAIREALSFEPISVPVTEAVGCLIDRPTRTTDGPTYSKEIAPIFDAKCVACHRPGEVGPFSLASYGDTLGWAATIGEVVDQRRMPPWGAEGGHFANDRSLSSAERDLILAWVDAGAPEGNPADRPAPPTFASGWSITPDRVYTAPEFAVPKEGTLDYQEFVIDPGLAQDTWVSDIEIRPRNRAVVHHATALLKPKDAKPGLFYFDSMFDNYLALYVPGNSVTSLPVGFAKRIPGGWNLVLQVHYVPNGQAATDRTSVGITFARSAAVQVATRMAESPIQLRPHEVRTASAEFTLDDEYLLVALYPHMHLRGKSMLFEAIFPDGRREQLLNVPDYDFEWQHRYVLREPRPLPAGTRLHCTSVFDNSAANRRNPDPSAFVKYGDATTDEMFFGAFELGRPIDRGDKSLALAWCAVAVGLVVIVRKRITRPIIQNASSPVASR